MKRLERIHRIGVDCEEVRECQQNNQRPVAVQFSSRRRVVGIVLAVVAVSGLIAGIAFVGAKQATADDATSGTVTIQVVTNNTFETPTAPPTYDIFRNATERGVMDGGRSVCSIPGGQPGSSRYECSCDSTTNQCATDQNYKCNDQGTFCEKWSPSLDCVDDDTEEFYCKDCKDYADIGFCTGSYYCSDDDTCTAKCAAFVGMRRTVDKYDFGCNCTDATGDNPCPLDTHVCYEGMQRCSMRCDYRVMDRSHKESYRCDACDDSGNACRDGYDCEAGTCNLRCDAFARPKKNSYECAHYPKSECLATHIYSEEEEACVFNSCRDPAAQCICSKSNPCPDNKLCVADPNGLGSICSDECALVPSSGATSTFECRRCTQRFVFDGVDTLTEADAATLGASTYNPCPLGYRCEQQSKCVQVTGPPGFADGFTDSDVCMTDSVTGFKGYAYWNEITQDADVADCISSKGVDCPTEPTTSYACTCADQNDLLDPAKGCSPFFQHTAVGRRMLFDLRPSDGDTYGQSALQGMLSKDWNIPNALTECDDIFTYRPNMDTVNSRLEQTSMVDQRFAQSANECLQIRVRKPIGSLVSNEAASIGGQSLWASEYTNEITEPGQYTHTRLVDHYTGGPADLASRAAYLDIRNTLYENMIKSRHDGIIPDVAVADYESAEYERKPFTLFEVATKYIKPKHLHKCNSITGVMRASTDDPDANIPNPYSSIFASYMKRLQNSVLYDNNNTATWAAFRSKYNIPDTQREEYDEYDDTPAFKNKKWTELDVLLYKLNKGIPFDFHVTATNWQDQLCLWNGDVGAPIGVKNALGANLQTDPVGDAGSLCHACRIPGTAGQPCLGSICATSESVSSFEADRGQCGIPPNQDQCMCKHPIDADVFEDGLGVYQLHWSSWESKMVRDSNGLTSGQCGKAVKCYANPDRTDEASWTVKKVPEFESASTDSSAASFLWRFSRFLPFEYFNAEGSNMQAVCQCRSPDYYTAVKSPQYDFCESRTFEHRIIDELNSKTCQSNDFYIEGADDPKHGQHLPGAQDIFCNCSGTDGCVVHECNIERSTGTGDDGKCICKKVDSTTDIFDLSGEPATRTFYYYGDKCERKSTCYSRTGYPTTYDYEDNKCVCGQPTLDDSVRTRVFRGEDCGIDFNCHGGTVTANKQGPVNWQSDQVYCTCNMFNMRGARSDYEAIKHSNDTKHKFMKAYVDWSMDKKNQPLENKMYRARRELLPGFYAGSSCNDDYVHCAFGEPMMGTTCPGGLLNSRCCKCLPHYTGKHCDIPCGFMCSPYAQSSSQRKDWVSDSGTPMDGKWLAEVNSETGLCESQELNVFNAYTTGDGSDAVSKVFGVTKLGIGDQLNQVPQCGNNDDPWLDLYEPVCKFDSDALFAGPDKIFEPAALATFMTYTENTNTNTYVEFDKWTDDKIKSVWTSDPNWGAMDEHAKAEKGLKFYKNLKREGWDWVSDYFLEDDPTTTPGPTLETCTLKTGSEDKINKTKADYDCVPKTCDSIDDPINKTRCDTANSETTAAGVRFTKTDKGVMDTIINEFNIMGMGDINTAEYTDRSGLASRAVRDAEEIVAFSRRIMWLSLSQQLAEMEATASPDSGRTFTYDKLPPWFRSEIGSIEGRPIKDSDNKFASERSNSDKCDYPETFPEGSLDDMYWGVHIDRIAFNGDDTASSWGLLGEDGNQDIFDIEMDIKFGKNLKGMKYPATRPNGPRGREIKWDKGDAGDLNYPYEQVIKVIKMTDSKTKCNTVHPDNCHNCGRRLSTGDANNTYDELYNRRLQEIQDIAIEGTDYASASERQVRLLEDLPDTKTYEPDLDEGYLWYLALWPGNWLPVCFPFGGGTYGPYCSGPLAVAILAHLRPIDGKRYHEELVQVMFGRDDQSEANRKNLKDAYDKARSNEQNQDVINGDTWFYTVNKQFPSTEEAGCKIKDPANYMRDVDGSGAFTELYIRNDFTPYATINRISFKDYDRSSADDTFEITNLKEQTPNGKERPVNFQDGWTQSNRNPGEFFKWVGGEDVNGNSRFYRFIGCSSNSDTTFDDYECRKNVVNVFVKLVKTKIFL